VAPGSKLKSTPPLLPTTQDSRGFALISVLALVSLAALTATAFLASARLEKTAAMTTGDQTRLTLALDSGYHLASYPYTRGDDTWNWADFLVGEDADGVGYLYHATPRTNTTTGEWTNYALFSCATMSNIGPTLFNPSNWAASTVQQGGFASNRLNSTSQLCKMTNFSTTNVTSSGPVTRIPLLFSRTSPIVNWITNYVTNPSTGLLSPTFRFAYFTEDPSGLIDVDRMGGSTSRDTGTNPTEIALGEVGITNFGTFTNLRRLFLTPGMIEDVLRISKVTNGSPTNSNSVTNPWRYLSSSFYSMNGLKSTLKDKQLQAYHRIPAGLGYNEADTNAGSTNKYLLNTNFTGGKAKSSAFAGIAGAITNNLPQFGTTRSGAMSSSNYISNIVANIIDYADTDANPTASGGGTVGYDNYPLPVVFSDKIAWNKAAIPSNSTIEVTTYIQLWNCSTVTSPAVTYTLINNFQDKYLKSNGTISPVRIFPNSLSNQLSVPALGPNQIIILATTNQTNVGANATYPGGLQITNTLGINNSSKNGYATNTNLFELCLTNGTIISQHKGYYTRIGQQITNGSWDFEGTVLTMSRPDGIAPIGDPRMLRFITNSSTNTLDYRSSESGNLKWGGYANFKDKPSAANIWNGHPDNWPEGRKSTVASLTGTNQTGGAGQPIPYGVGYTNTLPGTAPAILSTNGKFLTIWELGNVFDPMQWKPPATFTANTNYYNCSINQTWTNTGGEMHGGGNTLRIGRPEHSRFAWTNVSGQAQPNMQASAVALLDIFCVDNNTDDNIIGRFDDGNQININTAPPRVLRALASGVILTNDPATNIKIPTTAIDAFVKGVTNFRAKYPFYSASQLMFIGTNNNWPNTNTWPAGAVFSADVVRGTNTSANFQWSDAAAEEWFSKIYALSKVQSRNYRIYVQAQLIRTKGTNTNVSTLSFGTIAHRYYDVLNQQNNNNPPNCSMYLLRKVDY